MKMIRLQYTLAKCRNMGYVCFVRYYKSVLFENNILRKTLEGYQNSFDFITFEKSIFKQGNVVSDRTSMM